MNQTHVIERAFQIADENRACLKISDLHEALAREGYTITDLMHLQGWSIREQLRTRMRTRGATSARLQTATA
ncbi:hypothetical protein HNP32_001165 [Brevundimonas bullata]|jgi:hypothetical protein|uniref:Uncharacterized protein n=1 Tax=Brevundimonas bullata TaxID=13160 RepID=A0A7W7IN78_9CAUL|nr:hypothetical protein [Brevundimonas bullata]MBB4797441.1 hypothetical protein [Brevundimonas bullata]MBB6382401.1 hypothetical protein [Brevundimonas bullata]